VRALHYFCAPACAFVMAAHSAIKRMGATGRIVEPSLDTANLLSSETIAAVEYFFHLS
jgi:hypothetical protein